MGQRLKTLAPYLLIIGLGALLFAPLLGYGFVDFDDSTLLIDHLPTFRDFSNLTKVFTHDFLTPVTSGYYYRPLLAASLIINAQLFGGASPKIYHLFDLLLHLLVSLLLFVLLQKLTSRRGACLLASLIFLVHPVVLQTVAWIPARNDSLATIFVLLTFITFIKFLERGRVLIYILHVLFFLLAVLSKELTLLFPLLLFFYGKFTAKAKIRSLAPLFIGWVAAAVLWYLLRSTVINTTAFNFSSLVKSVYLNSVGIIIYLGKIILPLNLSTYPVFEDSNLLYGFISLVAVALILIFSKNKHWGQIILGSAWFLLFLLPGLVRPDTLAMTPEFLEHRAYLPFIGILIILQEADFFKTFDIRNKKHLLIAALVLVGLSTLNLTHSRNFKDSFSYWQKAVQTSPHSAFARKQLGVALLEKAKTDEAEAEYLKALQLNSGELFVNYNLGVINIRKGQYKAAELYFQKEIALNRFYENGWLNLATAFYLQNDLQRAVAVLEELIELNPNQLTARENLAIFYLKLQNPARALEQYQELLNRGGSPSPALSQEIQKYR